MGRVPTRFRSFWLAAALVCVLGLAACGDDDDDEQAATTETTPAAADAGHTYVGKVSGSDAYVAIVTNSAGDQAGGYVCDGKELSLWIGKSPLSDGQGTLLGRADGEPVGSVEIAADGATGEVTLDGEAHAFSAEAASGGGGLRHATESKGGEVTVETGWVVLADSSFKGIRKTSTTTTTAGKPTAGTTVGWIDPDVNPWIDPEVAP